VSGKKSPVQQRCPRTSAWVVRVGKLSARRGRNPGRKLEGRPRGDRSAARRPLLDQRCLKTIRSITVKSNSGSSSVKRSRRIEYTLAGLPVRGRRPPGPPGAALLFSFRECGEASRVPASRARHPFRPDSSTEPIGMSVLATSGRPAICGGVAAGLPSCEAGLVAGRRSGGNLLAGIDTRAGQRCPIRWLGGASRADKTVGGPTTRDAERPGQTAPADQRQGTWTPPVACRLTAVNRGISPGAGPKPGPRSDTSPTAKHPPEWPTQ
jgi:hypothetical protein